jgi:hypothetical protein
MLTWICDIPGASPAVSAWHFTLELGLAAFVVIGGLWFLGSAVIAYRRPVAEPERVGPHPD